jgi:hypothetical protein
LHEKKVGSFCFRKIWLSGTEDGDWNRTGLAGQRLEERGENQDNN